MQLLRAPVLLICLQCCAGPLANAQQEVADANSKPTKKLIVGTKDSPPFAFKNPDGKWTGISIELWKHLATELDLEYEFKEESLEGLLSGVESGELDAAVAAISVTAERHGRFEFCHPHFSTGLGIAVSVNQRASLWEMASRVVSLKLLGVILTIIAVLLVCGYLFWLLERNQNPATFGGSKRQGIEMGMWWSTVLLLGHKGVSPASNWARIIAVLAMLASILLASLLTGVIASALTVQQLDSGIDHPSDLRHKRVACVESSAAADYLVKRRIAYAPYKDVDASLSSVLDGKADAVVYDQALLKHLVNQKYASTLVVLPVSFNAQEYAIALRPGSPLRKPLNEALLTYRSSDSWDELVFRYLGE